MIKYLGYILIPVVLIALISGWYYRQQHNAEQRGIDKQIAINLAAANQRIAERRIKDENFNKDNARTVCERDGFEWVFSDNKSYCR